MGDEIRTSAEVREAAVLAGLHEVHTRPDAQNAGDRPVPKALSAKPAEQKSPARWAYERIIVYLKNFEEELDNTQEVAMGFAGGDTGVLRIEGMGYFDPDIVTFYGSDESGSRMQLIQHVSQLNVMLRALPVPREREAPQRIGFRLVEDLEAGGKTDSDDAT
ncbi:hypothetical protein [uncultured Roseobacter sp.]|uniref:hypothetical protein n=1 Tax=uncultured Roseobacter sp. TaxID=114847 RepID=UPI002611D66F|nr:hypothetical protein [uncultured Roseobacter sp.]